MTAFAIAILFAAAGCLSLLMIAAMLRSHGGMMLAAFAGRGVHRAAAGVGDRHQPPLMTSGREVAARRSVRAPGNARAGSAPRAAIMVGLAA